MKDLPLCSRLNVYVFLVKKWNCSVLMLKSASDLRAAAYTAASYVSRERSRSASYEKQHNHFHSNWNTHLYAMSYSHFWLPRTRGTSRNCHWETTKILNKIILVDILKIWVYLRVNRFNTEKVNTKIVKDNSNTQQMSTVRWVVNWKSLSVSFWTNKGQLNVMWSISQRANGVRKYTAPWYSFKNLLLGSWKNSFKCQFFNTYLWNKFHQIFRYFKNIL